MLKIITSVIAILVLLLAGCSAGSEPSAPSVAREGGQTPGFQLQNLEGQTISLSKFQGRPVLINFWAVWCPPCRAEMPHLQQIYEEWSGKGLVLLTINMGDSPSQVKEFLQSNKLSLPVLFDTKGDVANKYNIVAIPTSFFIDKDGIIQEKVVGAFPNKSTIEDLLKKIVP
ncbi:TlpA family protein disulfide reductase [Chloroflexota bacterium]